MAKTFLTPLNLLHSSSDPVSVPSGTIYFNTNRNVIRFFDGSVWGDLSAPNGGFTTQEEVNYLIQLTLQGMGFFDGGTAQGFVSGLQGGSSASDTSSAIINGGTA